MKNQINVKHIPERGCHNCRLHYVNHKKCDSESPCKQGMEWRPIIKPLDIKYSSDYWKDLEDKFNEDLKS